MAVMMAFFWMAAPMIRAKEPPKKLHLSAVDARKLVVVDDSTGALYQTLYVPDWPNPRLRLDREYWFKGNRGVVAVIGVGTKAESAVVYSFHEAGRYDEVVFADRSLDAWVDTPKAFRTRIEILPLDDHRIVVLWLQAVESEIYEEADMILLSQVSMVTLGKNNKVTASPRAYWKPPGKVYLPEDVLESYLKHPEIWKTK